MKFPLITMSLTPLRFTWVAGGAILVASGYCLAHGLVASDEINLPNFPGSNEHNPRAAADRHTARQSDSVQDVGANAKFA